MYVRRQIAPSIIWHFAWRSLCVFTFISILAVFLYSNLHLHIVSIPFLPVATVGTAVAFYAGFKNNASYERLWEARKIWAEIEHLSRFATMIVLKSSFANAAGSPLKRNFVYTQIAWANALRWHLRRVPTFYGDKTESLDQVLLLKKHNGDQPQPDDIMTSLLPIMSQAEAETILTARNLPTAVLFKQLSNLENLRADGLPEADYIKLLDVLGNCSQQQAAAERLNSFPFPRQYAHFSAVFVNIFVVLLPFSLITELKNAGVNIWLTIPFSVLVSWVFYTMERVGDTSENPFENALNDVPLSSICKEMEIDLKTMLGEADLPLALVPQHYVMM